MRAHRAQWGFVCAAVTSVVIAAPACSGSGDVHGALMPDPVVETVRATGRALFVGRAGCIECHKLGEQGTKIRGPNLLASEADPRPVGERWPRETNNATAIEYIVESILDPDRFVVDGYARGVMKRPDEPPISLSDEDVVSLAAFLAGEGTEHPLAAKELAVAARAVSRVRNERQVSAQRKAVELRQSQLDWKPADAGRGAAVFAQLGCGRCHDNAMSAVGAPSLRGVGLRRNRAELVGWIIAPPLTAMPSFDGVVDDFQLADLVVYLEGMK